MGSSRQSSTGFVHMARAISSRAVAIGQAPGRFVGAAKQADLAEPVGRALDGFLFGAGIAGQAQKAAERVAGRGVEDVVLRYQQVFEHGHAGEQPDVLEGAGHPRAAGDLEALHAFEQEQCAARCACPLPAAAGEPGSASKADAKPWPSAMRPSVGL